MKTVTNYNNFDIKLSKKGRYFVYSDIGLSDYLEVRLGGYDTLEEAKKSVDKFWERQRKL
ncbi:MAG: hypothetical protein Q4A23_00055 [bacterium]|nr:hypothetical protein [bacterium]